MIDVFFPTCSLFRDVSLMTGPSVDGHIFSLYCCVSMARASTDEQVIEDDADV